MGVTVEDSQSSFALPEEGEYLAVVADIIDLGPVTTKFGTKEKVQIVFLLDAYDSETGDQFRVSGFYTKSKHEKSLLRKAVKQIVGFDAFEEEGAVDLDELLLGKTVRVDISIGEGSAGKIYANINAILKAPKDRVLEIPADFQRKIEREGNGSTQRPVNSAKKGAPAKTAAKPATTQRTAPAPAEPKPGSKPVAALKARAVAPAPAPEAPVEAVETTTDATDSDIPF